MAQVQNLETMVTNAVQQNTQVQTQLSTLEATLQQVQAALNNLQNVQSAQQQAQRAHATANQVQSAPPTTLKEFRMPSVDAPNFNGSSNKKPPHEAQQTIDNYLYKVEEAAYLHKFRADGEPPRYINHPTYVDFAATGLSGIAIQKWRRIPAANRRQMTWSEYREWIKANFTSPLTLEKAIESLDELRQTGSAVAYSERFNELVEATRSNGTDYDDAILCVKYRKGLKPHLKERLELFKLTDLKDLQTEAERADEFFYQSSKHGRKDKHHSNHKSNTPSPRQEPKDDPMNLDAVNTKKSFRSLSKEDKETYRKNDWCSFCKSKEHPTRRCDHPNFRKDVYERNQQRSKAKSDDPDTIGGSAAKGSSA
jgi:hypothetical protein